jgi:hypothetical protein
LPRSGLVTTSMQRRPPRERRSTAPNPLAAGRCAPLGRSSRKAEEQGGVDVRLRNVLAARPRFSDL